MAAKERKITNHKLFDRYTVISSIIIVYGGLIICETLIGAIFGAAIGLTLRALSVENADTIAMVSINLIAVLGAFFVLSLFWRWFYPEYQGSIHGGRKVGMWVIICLALIAAMSSVQIITGADELGIPPIVNISTALMAGVCEEAVFRGLGVSYLMRQWGEKKDIWKVIGLSSLLFAVVHGVNLFSGAPVLMTIVQILNAFSMGCMVSTIFLRSGNLIPVMLLHFLNDFVAFMNVGAIAEGGTYNGDTAVSGEVLLSLFVFSAVFITLSLIFIRPSKRDEITALWNEKWSRGSQGRG